MSLSTSLRRRIAVGLTGALLGATLLTGAISVSADDTSPKLDRDDPPAQQADATVLQTTFVVVQSQSAPIASGDTLNLPAQVLRLGSTPDDRS
jgi:hypothetical protein